MIGDIRDNIKYLESNRTFEYLVMIDGNAYTSNEIIDFSISATMGDQLTIGNFTVRELNLNMLTMYAPAELADVVIEPFIDIQGAQSLLKLGTFIVEPKGIKRGREITSIKCYDALGKLGAGALSLQTAYTQTSLDTAIGLLTNIMGNTISTHGQQIIDGSKSYFHIDIPIGGNTIQRTLRDISAVCGATAVIDIDGNLDFIRRDLHDSIALGAGDYINFTAQSDDVFTIDGMTYTHPDPDNPDDPPLVYFYYGNPDGNTIDLVWDESNYMVESRDNEFKWLAQNLVKIPLSYQCYQLDTIGLPFIELGDYINLTDIDNNQWSLPVFKYTHTFNKGITSSFEAVYPL